MGEFEKLRRQIEDLNKKDDGGGADIERCFRDLFSTVEGERALQYMSDLWLDTQVFVPGDPHGTSYNLGHADLINFFKDCLKDDS